MSAGLNRMPEGGLKRGKDGFKRTVPLRVEGEDIPRETLGMLGDATRHIDTMTDSDGTVWYRVEDVRDAAGEEWSMPLGDLESEAPVKKDKKDSIFHYTTRVGVEHILAEIGTKRSRAVQQLMD